jgi:amino acid adenylation domain-containing protein
VALLFRDQPLTYKQLNDCANRLAHFLRKNGVGAESLVGVCFERSLEMVIALLAVLKAGGAYVPIDPEYPEDRRGYILKDSGASLVLTHAPCETKLRQIKNVFVYTINSNALAGFPDSDLPSVAGPHNAAYVIYTSGSTGTPKGVINTHIGIVNRLLWMQDRFVLNEADSVLQKTPYSFDVSVWEFFWPLMTGARLVIAEPGGHRDPSYLVAAIRDNAITIAHFVPSMLRVFLEHGDVPELHSLKRVICSGEALTYALQQRFFSLVTCPLFNLYGPTEASVDVSFWECRKNDERLIVPIGRPIANIRLYILDPAMRPVPVGIEGELYIGGIGVARGYVNLPNLTKEVFLPDPFSNAHGARLYRTGDICRYLSDGAIEYIGRKDNQVKMRGQRIELGEIENVVFRHNEVALCAVLCREFAPNDFRLIAYYVLRQRGSISAQDLRDRCVSFLPGSMVPHYFVELDAMPLTASGKTDRKTLQQKAFLSVANKQSIAPQTSDEIKMAEIWKRLLEVSSLGIDDDFFQKGGHSLLAIHLVSRVKESFGVDVPLSVFYNAATIDKLLLEMKRTGLSQTAAGPVCSEQTIGIPLSPSQSRLLFLCGLEPESRAFNLSTCFEISGPFDQGLAHTAIERVVERHDALRATFETNESGPTMRIHPTMLFEFETIDCASGARDCWTKEIITRSIRPYDLSAGPLLRILIVRIAQDRRIMAVMTHHIVSDGWSMGVFIRDFSHFYYSLTNTTQPDLPGMPCRFADYTAWQSLRPQVIGQVTREYWEQQLSMPLPILELPADRPRPSSVSYAGSSVFFKMPAEVRSGLERLCRDERTTIFTALLGVFYVLLSRYSGHSDIIIGSPTANRESPDLENLFGFFLNMAPMRIRVKNDLTFRQLVRNIDNVVRDGIIHHSIGFDSLVEIIKPKRDFGHAPVFQVMFAFENYSMQAQSAKGTSMRFLPVDRGATEFDLSLYMWPEQEGLACMFEYSVDLFDHDTIERMAAHFANIAMAVAANADTPNCSIPMLSQNERSVILDQWNDTKRPFPRDMCAHQLFTSQAAQTPSAVAVACGGRKYSYKQLDEASDGIVSMLVKNGVLPDDLVGLCMERSFDMVAALVGVLKSGAAYVPLDPNYPTERLAYMIEDAGLKLIVSDETTMSAVTFARSTIHVLTVHSLESGMPSCAAISVSPAQTAYIIYTSGSTGKPKGVRIPHSAVVNFLCSMTREPGIAPTDIVMAVTTLSFDISVLEILLPLSCGACTVIVDHETSRDAMQLAELIATSNATVMQGTPSTWRLLCAAGWNGSLALKALCGGEPLPHDLLRDLFPKVKELWNMYGPTETTVWSSCCRITGTQAPVLIGRPIANTTMYILDSAMQPVPIGVLGELYIGGAGLALGYHNRPELTGQRFLTSPFSDGNIYKTGDLARYRHDGSLECMGRIDSQVKIRGFRIELGEIENVMLSHANVRHCAAVCKEFSPGDTRLIAFYVLKQRGSMTVTDIRNHCKSFLPDYMVPQHYVEMDAMPLTPAGKTDRKSLQVPMENPAENKPARSEPYTAGEIYLAGVWKQALRVDKVSAQDNFFDIGGHSLLSMSVITKIKNETGVEIHPRAMMLNTLKQIAENHDLRKKAEKTESSSIKKIGKLFKRKNQ